ncbi:MAG: metallophosphoesterase family protein [Lentisphaeria bacterium]|nr:metallophosphoesterase family protein [Lentisphaeria bacterium]
MRRPRHRGTIQLSGRRFARSVCRWFAGLLLMACLTALYALYVEPVWLAERRIVLSTSAGVCVVHITDLHYRGSRRYLERVVERVNGLDADIVCVTGDIVEELPYLEEALGILARVKRPMYGIRGIHDCWDAAAVVKIKEVFAATGGRWLLDERVLALDGTVEVAGSTASIGSLPRLVDSAAKVRLLLVHDPAAVERAGDVRFDLILAGHTHGGQLRIPGGGPIFDLPLVGKYDRGLFQTGAGPLYVNPGIGTYGVPARFCCRPEIAAIEL